MAGVEVAGLVFGVLPILIETVKSYSSVSQCFHDFRHYSKEVALVQLQLEVRHRIFLNECRLLLRLVEDEEGAKDMLEDEADQRWTSKDLNDRLNEVLKDDLELCRSIIKASKGIVDAMREEMKKFDVLVDQKDKSESIKDTIRRLRNAVRITFDKAKYEKSLSSLRDWNTELGQLRGHIGAFQQRSSLEHNCVRNNLLPSHIRSIKTASQKLHEALSDAWCCSDLSHAGHYAKLCLDVEVQAEVRLDLAISCHGNAQQQDDTHIPESPIWLYVQSISLDAAKVYAKPPKTITSSESSTSAPNTPLSSTSGLKKKASHDLSQLALCRNKKKKQVHFSDTSEQFSIDGAISKEVTEAISQTIAQQSTPQINLCHTKNICHYLKQNLQICDKQFAGHCVGYLESPQMYRHMFYLQEKKLSTNSKDSGQDSILSINDVMMEEADEVLSIVDQLRLAHKAALALLQFHDTPWLSERWRLKDLSYFGNRESFNEEALKTLHLSSQISSTAKPDCSVMEGVECPEEAVSDEDIYGINNTTLFSLGVALLEIGHWKPIEEQKIPKDPNEILTARRLAAGRHSPLGPKYQEITRKCLQCNFGFGTDLNKKELQSAVHGDVVRQLEMMIDVLV